MLGNRRSPLAILTGESALRGRLGCTLKVRNFSKSDAWPEDDMTKSKHVSNERRAAPRYEVRKDGRLLFIDQPCFVECAIRNISEDGALVSMLVSVSLPPVVLLWEQRTGAIHECEVRWRKGRTVGVHFTDVYGRATRRAMLEKDFAPLRNVADGATLLH